LPGGVGAAWPNGGMPAMIKFILFGIFLILHGLMLVGVNIGGSIMTLIAAAAAIGAGILMLFNR
jgi:hypothetical protein